MIQLRDYQEEMINVARRRMVAGDRRVLLVAPTGAGKRIMAVYALGRAVGRGRRCAMIVHRQELLDQAVDTIRSAGLRCGVIKAGLRPDPHLPIQVASIQSLSGRLDRIAPFDFIHVDEAHHAAARTWATVLAAHPNAHVLGYTATPLRTDGRGLGERFDAIVVGPTMRELIDAGHLADYRLFAPPAPDVSGVRTVAGDFNRGQLAAAVDRPAIVGDVVAHYLRHATGKRAICFAVGVGHSKHLAEAFNRAGIEARHADGETPTEERRKTLADFAAGRFRVLCNVDILGEGLDVPGIEAVICARPTQSLTVWLQQVGRGLRVKPDGSRAIVLDHAGNSRRLGLPDEERVWSLTGDRIAKRKAGDVPVKVCPECEAACPIGTHRCPECGHEYEIAARERTEVGGELTEVDPVEERGRRLSEQGSAHTLGELIRLGTRRGYPNPYGWAKHVMGARSRHVRTSAPARRG